MTSFRERNPLRVGIASIAVLAALLAVAFFLKKLPFVVQSYTLTAEFADAAGLSPDNEVRVAGIKVGRVTGVDLGTDRVIVTMDINEGVDIPRDAKAEISLKTILGTKFVTVDARGEGAPLKDGDRIPLERTTIPFEIYQIANAAVDLLTDVDGKQLNDAFTALADVTSDPNRNLARTVEGAADVLDTLAGKRSSLDQLIQKGEDVLASLDRSSPDIQAILKHTNVVAEVIGRRRATVRALLLNTERLATQLGGLLKEKRPQLDEILTDLHTTLRIVDASLGEVEEAIRLLGPSTEAFARIAWNGRWASICTMAMNASALPPELEVGLDVSVGTGNPESANGPVDCGTSNAVSTRAPAGRTAALEHRMAR